MKKLNSVIIGKVLSTHGIHGWLSISCYAHPPENLKKYDTFEMTRYQKLISMMLK